MSALYLRLSRALPFVVLLSASLARNAAGETFYMGADTSLTTFMQQQNVAFTDNSVAKPIDQLLYDRGANLFRLRIFVDPQTTYTNQNSGAIQTQAYDIALAQQIKAHAPNAKLLLDFHYSDTWADPGHQTKPAAWASLSFAQLQSTIQTYTQDTLLAFKNAGVMPDMVQLGNEISTGMLWGTTSNPAGGKLVFTGSTSTQRTSWQNLGSLLNSAIQGVRGAQGAGPKIDVAIHIDQGDQDGHPQYYFGNLTNPTWGNVSDFDVVGVSYYPTTQAFHSFSLLQSNLNAMADSYPGKKLMVLETAYPWQTSSVGTPQWSSTPGGQQQFLSDLQNMVLNLHNNAGAGLVYWYPESVQVPGYSIYNSGATALFDASRSALPALSTFGITLIPGDYDHDGQVSAADYVLWSKNVGTPAAYDTWRANFSQAAGVGTSVRVNSAVPEPATLTLLIFVAAGWCLRRYRAA